MQFDIPVACTVLPKSHCSVLQKVAYELKSYPETVPSLSSFHPPIIHSDARVARQHSGGGGIGAVCSYGRGRDGIAMTPADSPMVNSAKQAIYVRSEAYARTSLSRFGIVYHAPYFSLITFRQSE